MRARGLLFGLVVLGTGFGVFLGCGDDDHDANRADAGTGGGGGTPVDAGGGAVPDAAVDAGPPVAPYDWVGVIGTGQSLSVGATAGILSTTASFDNGKLVDDGPDPKYPLDGGTARYSVAPLVEPIRLRPLAGYADAQYPSNIVGETPHSGMASELTTLFRERGGASYVSMHTVVGWSGHPLSDLNKQGPGRAYPGSLQEVRAFRQLAAAQGKTYGVGGIILTHGESDAANLAYGAGLQSFVADYSADIKAITGQTRDVVMFVSQQSVAAGPTSSAVQVWKAGLAEPRLVCVGPKYQYGYSPDHLHFPAPGYRRLGEKYAEVFDAVVNQGKAWKPVQPRTITRSGKQIVIAFDVPNPPLVWDETLAAPHQTVHTEWKNGRGFEVLDGTTPATIATAELTAADTVTLTLASAPTGTVTVQYATTQDAASGYNGGLVSGYRGQLADSDALVGYDEETLSVLLTNGSPTVTIAGDASALAHRAVRDIVTGAGVPAWWTVAAIGAGSLTMASPWTGTTGAATVKIHHDLRNYAVHFAQTAP